MTWPPATHQDVQDKIDANVTTISGKADTASLATVATSGDYADLTNKPTIPPPAPVDSVNGETGAVVLSAADVGAQPAGSYATGAQGALADTAVQPGDLATVATTGSYGDLSNQPTIPPPAPVDSVNSKTGAVVLSASDVGALDKATADGLYVAQANAIDLEGVEDDVARMFTGGTQSGITFAYDDTNGVINTTVTPGPASAPGIAKKWVVLRTS